MPMVYRGEFWTHLIGNDLKINAQIFEEMKMDYTYGQNSDEI